MRIISGTHKGRKIQAPKNLPVRPTTDMCKESLFNILQNRCDYNELKVLDLFSGTGNISYEFASRGATKIVAVDADFGCCKFIKQTAETFEFPIHVIKSNVFQFLEKNTNGFDIVFADPPYSFSDADLEKIITLVFKNQALTSNGLLILEHTRQIKTTHWKHFSFQKNYGQSVFSFFEP